MRTAELKDAHKCGSRRRAGHISDNPNQIKESLQKSDQVGSLASSAKRNVRRFRNFVTESSPRSLLKNSYKVAFVIIRVIIYYYIRDIKL